MSLNESVRTLRGKLGESQQAFANRLGVSIRAVANYEKDRAPTGKALAALARAARDIGDGALTLKFTSALAAELGTFDVQGVGLDVEPRTSVETLAVAALLKVLREPKYSDTVRQIVDLLREPAASSVRAYRHQFESKGAPEIERLLQLGKSPQAISELLDVDVGMVHAYQLFLTLKTGLEIFRSLTSKGDVK